MVTLVQRVRRASVEVEGETVGSIEKGMLILLGVHEDDTDNEAAWLARKCAGLRIFPDSDDRMNHSLRTTRGEALVVSQFTLYADVSRGNRPSFDNAARAERAEMLYGRFVDFLDEQIDSRVQTGVFGRMMDIHLTNDGPVTLWIERLHPSP